MQTIQCNDQPMSILSDRVQASSYVHCVRSAGCLGGARTSEAQANKCYICSFVAEDRTALKRHLSNAHNFSVFDWKPSRTVGRSADTCTLWYRIIYGRCAQFDRDRAWARCGDNDIHGHFVKGNIKAIFADADMRKRLTLSCQFCKDSYQMVKHMANHMYVHHGELAQKAEMLCQWPQNTFIPTYGCVCNLNVKKLQQAHVCLPFLQLAMMRYQRGDWIFLPIIYTEEIEEIRDSMITHVPIKTILHVCDWLRDREFQQLFNDPRIRQALRTSCFCCGKQLTIGGASVERNLDFHLRAEHLEPQQAINTLIDMVQNFHANDSEQSVNGACETLQTLM